MQLYVRCEKNHKSYGLVLAAVTKIRYHIVYIITGEKNKKCNTVQMVNIFSQNGTSHFVHAILTYKRILGNYPACFGNGFYMKNIHSGG